MGRVGRGRGRYDQLRDQLESSQTLPFLVAALQPWLGDPQFRTMLEASVDPRVIEAILEC